MEMFLGKAHLPGAAEEWNIKLEIDWDKKEVNVHIDEDPGGINDWPGLVVETFGPIDEAVFRTKGIPGVFTHLWHFVHSGETSGALSSGSLMPKAFGEPAPCHLRKLNNSFLPMMEKLKTNPACLLVDGELIK